MLHGSGLWIPLGAARRIHSACLKVKKRLAQRDREQGRNHYRHVDTAPHADTNAGPAAGHGEEQQHPQHAGDAEEEEEEAAEPVVVMNKADARREYEAELIREKKAAREEAALLKSGKVRKQSEALKQHPEELQHKIESIRRYVVSISSYRKNIAPRPNNCEDVMTTFITGDVLRKRSKTQGTSTRSRESCTTATASSGPQTRR